VKFPLIYGATVRLSSPSAEPLFFSSSQAADSGPDNRLQGVKIVVVDDNADARLLLETVLKRDGALTATCESGKNALALIKTFLPDVVVSDILMPEMDGYRFLGELRTLGTEQGGEVPVIALTAFARGSESARITQAGFQLHISKPIDPEELVRAIEDLVRKRQGSG
jgi:CheY-like chemotaxis protein